MTETEAKPEPLKIEYKTVITIVMALTSLWVATIVRLQNNVTIQMGLATQRSRAEAVAAFGKLTRTDQRVGYSLDVYSDWYEAQQQANQASSSAQAARIEGDETNALAQDAVAERWKQLQFQLSDLTPLLSSQYAGNYSSYYEDLHQKSHFIYQRQLAFDREAASWRAKAANYRTTMSMLSVSLFLLGMSLNINNWVKYLFSGAAAILIGTTVVIAIQTIQMPIQRTPESAIAHFVEGQTLSNKAYVAPVDEAKELNAMALAAFDAALEIDDQYAEAFQWHGFTLLQTRLQDADPQRNAQAAQDMETAISLGSDGSVVYTNLGWAYTLAGEYSQAINALQSAIEAEPTECTARMNLGLAYLANAQTDASAQAYDGALACLLLESPDEQANLFASALIDLHDLQTIAPDTPSIEDTIERLKETSASLKLVGDTSPAETSAVVSEVTYAGNISLDGDLIDQGDSFTPGSPSIYTILSFEDMQEGTTWMVRWYTGGELYDEYIADVWSGGSAGQARVRLRGAPLPAGEYFTEIYADGNLIAESSFEVQAGETAVMQPYVSSSFRILLNHPIEWLVTENRSENGSLYIANPDDASNYLWYTSFPWEEMDNDSVLSGLMVLWYSQHPDIEFLEQSEFFLGGLAQATFVPAIYSDEDGNQMGTYLVGMAHEGYGYLLVLQSPAETFEETYAAIFDPMLRSLEIAPPQ